jgi:uncharacterized protein (TIGR02145 family)
MKKFYFAFVLAGILAFNLSAQEVLDSIQISQGWNLIGSIVTGPVDSVIYTIPPNAITSPLYEFSTGNTDMPSGYTVADIIKIMKGYWAKADIAGWLYFRRHLGPFWPGCGTVDYAGKTYQTVVIGDQCWLRENLDVGTMIPGSMDQTNNLPTNYIEKYCFEDNPANCNIYGGLYQWDEAMQYVTTTGAQGICPNGWHIPSYADFATLKSNVGDDGNKLKAIGQGSGSGTGTNTSGFSALLAGYRDQTSIFNGVTTTTIFWSSQQNTSLNAHSLSLNGTTSNVNHTLHNKPYGLSIRCIKN